MLNLCSLSQYLFSSSSGLDIVLSAGDSLIGNHSHADIETDRVGFLLPKNCPCSRLGLYPQSVREERQLSREASRGVFCIVSHIRTEMHEFPEIPQKALRAGFLLTTYPRGLP